MGWFGILWPLIKQWMANYKRQTAYDNHWYHTNSNCIKTNSDS